MIGTPPNALANLPSADARTACSPLSLRPLLRPGGGEEAASGSPRVRGDIGCAREEAGTVAARPCACRGRRWSGRSPSASAWLALPADCPCEDGKPASTGLRRRARVVGHDRHVDPFRGLWVTAWSRGARAWALRSGLRRRGTYPGIRASDRFGCAAGPHPRCVGTRAVGQPAWQCRRSVLSGRRVTDAALAFAAGRKRDTVMHVGSCTSRLGRGLEWKAAQTATGSPGARRSDPQSTTRR